MTTQLSDDGLLFVDGSLLNNAHQAGFKNAVIDGNFAINLANVSGTVSLTAGQYGHTMWKAGASGCTYTFNTVQNITTITIYAGSLLQVIEGNKLRSGQRVLSWQGTSLGRIDTGPFGTSGVIGTAVGGTNQTVEFGVGTVSLIQYEPGSKASPFANFDPSIEELRANRYYNVITCNTTLAALSGIISCPVTLPVAMRGIPTASFTLNSQSGNAGGWPIVSVTSNKSFTVDQNPVSANLTIGANLTVRLDARL